MPARSMVVAVPDRGSTFERLESAPFATHAGFLADLHPISLKSCLEAFRDDLTAVRVDRHKVQVVRSPLHDHGTQSRRNPHASRPVLYGVVRVRSTRRNDDSDLLNRVARGKWSHPVLPCAVDHPESGQLIVRLTGHDRHAAGRLVRCLVDDGDDLVGLAEDPDLIGRHDRDLALHPGPPPLHRRRSTCRSPDRGSGWSSLEG